MKMLRALIYDWLPRPLAVTPAQGKSLAPSAVMILSKHPNPTYSYYLEDRVRAIQDVPVSVRGLDAGLEDLDPRGLFVIICRYIKPRQLAWLETNRSLLAGVALFIDDDIASVIVGNEASWRYKLKLFYLAIWPIRRLNRVLTDIWVSTDGLAEALAPHSGAVKVLPPFPPRYAVAPSRPQPGRSVLKMVYHATGVHRLEHEFLVPIVTKALERHPDLSFEVFASGKTANLWLQVPAAKGRITVRKALPWSDYLKETSAADIDICLIPLLEGRTNSSRSGTKRIDISRCGAAAVFSACAVYQRDAVSGELHVTNTADAWLGAIDELVTSPERRLRARHATAMSIDRMRDAAPLALPGFARRHSDKRQYS